MKITSQSPAYGVNYFVGCSAFNIRRHDFVAAGIRWFEHWDNIPDLELPLPSHTYIITGQNETEEAFGNGVHSGTLSAYFNDPNVAVLVRKPIGWTPEIGIQIVNAAMTYDGQKYAYWQIAAMAASHSFFGQVASRLTGGWLGHQLEKMADSKDSAICSEVVAGAMLEVYGKRGCLKGHAPFNVNPAMLFGDNELYEPDAIELLPSISSGE